MSSASNQPPPISSDEYAASREDFDLFRRLLRVAHLLKAHEIDDLWNQDPAFTQHTRHNGADGGFLGLDLTGNTPRSIEHAAGMDNGCNNDNDDEYDDDDDDDDEEDEEEKGEGAEEDRINAAAIFSQPVGPSNKAPQTSRRKQPNNQQNNTGAVGQRQRRQQQQRPHAAVEKRYRSVVNSKIQQLSASIPASNTFSLIDSNTPPEDQEAGAMQKMPTKSVVLDRAIQYINHLVSTYEQYETEHNELRRKLQLCLDDISPAEMPKATNI